MYKIDNSNRDLIIERYVDDIVGGLHFLEVKERLKALLIKEKMTLDNDYLEIEVQRHDPNLLVDIYLEEIVQGGYHEPNFS